MRKWCRRSQTMEWDIRNNAQLTATTESRAATARMSAHDTTGPPQASSTADLILSTTSNPLTELLLGTANFSLTNSGLESKRLDPSQPYIIIHVN